MRPSVLSSDIPWDGGLTCALEFADLQAALEWYQEVLGFELIYVIDELAWAEPRSPVNRVKLGLGQVERPQTRRGATLTRGTRDIEAARNTLAAAGGQRAVIPPPARTRRWRPQSSGSFSTCPGLIRSGLSRMSRLASKIAWYLVPLP